MRAPHIAILAGAVAFGIASQTAAQNWTVGIGTDGVYSSDEQEALSLELIYAGQTRGTVAGFDYGFGAGLETDADGDIWLGAGLHAQRDLGAVRLSLSVMPGLYEEGKVQTDLGGTVAIRSRIGLSVPAGAGHIGISYAHISNGGLYDDNPGKNAAYVTYGLRY